MDFRHYPQLTPEEFSEVCHHLDRRYCQATLGPLRRRWRLKICTALDTMFSLDGGYVTFIQIIRPLEAGPSQDELSLGLENFSFSERDRELGTRNEGDRQMEEAEEADEAAIREDPALPDVGHVIYEIHLHPTYRVPCLWFTLHGLPVDEPAFSIDTIFRRLVPDEFKDGLRRQGSVGGISADHHPITGVPAFFLHPCLVADNMLQFDCSKTDYLMIWLGLTGGCVGLWAPKEMAMHIL